MMRAAACAALPLMSEPDDAAVADAFGTLLVSDAVMRIRITASDTSKVPNASATAASSGSDINGKAAQAAARIIKQRLTDFAAQHFGVAFNAAVFRANAVHAGDHS